MGLFMILLIPVIATLICMVPVKEYKLSAWATIIGSLTVLILSASIAFDSGSLVNGGTKALGGWLFCDGFSALIVLLVSFAGFTAAVFSFGYMKVAKTGNSSEQEFDGNGKEQEHGNGQAHCPGHASIHGHEYSHKQLRIYYALYNMFLLSMLAVPVFANVAIVWIAVELTTLLSVFLVGFDNTSEALEAAWKYVVLTCMGAAIALIGVLILYWGLRLSGTDQFTWTMLMHAAPKIKPVFLKSAFLFILIGFGTKAGLVPLHTWLPDAHSQAPSPVCALLSGIETTTALYVIMRLVPLLKTISGNQASPWLITFGMISVGSAAFLLIQVKDYKRLFAFSTIEHMGIILVAAGLASKAADLGAVSQIMAHTLTKSFCFFAAGAVLLVTGTRNISSVRGLIRTSPATGAALLFGGLAIAGAPPFVVFLSEFSIIRAGLASGHYIIIGALTIFIAIAFCGIMSHINGMVFGRPKVPDSGTVLLPVPCKLTLALAVVPVVVLGIYTPHVIHTLLQLAAYSIGR